MPWMVVGSRCPGGRALLPGNLRPARCGERATRPATLPRETKETRRKEQLKHSDQAKRGSADRPAEVRQRNPRESTPAVPLGLRGYEAPTVRGGRGAAQGPPSGR